MVPTKQRLVDSITTRLKEEVSANSMARFLRDYPVEDYVEQVIATVYLYTRTNKANPTKQTTFAEIISAIGHGVRNKFSLPRKSGVAARAGAFLLYSFEDIGLLRLVYHKGENNHAAYFVEVLDDEKINELWNKIGSAKTEKLPVESPYPDWKESRHPTGARIVKTGSQVVLSMLTPERHPIVFRAINRKQHVGWRVNADIFELSQWALRNKTDAFADIWEMQNPEAKASKLRESRSVIDIASRFKDSVFYHLYYCDFRGRIYPATTSLHEQGSDLAKGLLLRESGKALGEQGFYWLCISLANNWAGESGREDGAKTDKIPLNERVYWAMDNEEILLSYADNPKVNQGWMKADKAWQFLAACFELLKFRAWQLDHPDSFDFVSHIEVFIDGSTNGSQHLAALTRDETTAPHVNLVPSKLPGDLYAYIANSVWDEVHKNLMDIPLDLQQQCEEVVEELVEQMKGVYEHASDVELRKKLVEKLQAFKRQNKEYIEISSPIFWSKITDRKHRRKILKRNVMTLPYGGTSYGLGEQQIKDARKHGIPALMHMTHKWGAYMGRTVFDSCGSSMARPMCLLALFEKAGKAAEDRGEFLSWTVPKTDFPVVQHYVEGTVKKQWIQYGPQIGDRLNTGHFVNTYQVSICFIEETKHSKRRQAQGAAPNIIHSLDAAHLMLTIDACPFDITTIHDSFGCLAADMPELYVAVRETFYELYKDNPIVAVMKDIQIDMKEVPCGSLDISLVVDSEYCFA